MAPPQRKVLGRPKRGATIFRMWAASLHGLLSLTLSVGPVVPVAQPEAPASTQAPAMETPAPTSADAPSMATTATTDTPTAAPAPAVAQAYDDELAPIQRRALRKHLAPPPEDPGLLTAGIVMTSVAAPLTGLSIWGVVDVQQSCTSLLGLWCWGTGLTAIGLGLSSIGLVTGVVLLGVGLERRRAHARWSATKHLQVAPYVAETRRGTQTFGVDLRF